MKGQSNRKIVPTLSCLMLICFLLVPNLCMADHDDRGRIRIHKDHDYENRKQIQKREDDGNETTGETAAWIFAVANFTVVLSILIKWITRFVPLTSQVKDQVNKFNNVQKKHLKRFHYWLNPIAFTIVVFHWLLSHCNSSSLPELGLCLVLLSVGFGLILKFKISPVSIRKTLYRIHTNPILLLAIVSVLLIGHSIVD